MRDPGVSWCLATWMQLIRRQYTHMSAQVLSLDHDWMDHCCLHGWLVRCVRLCQ